MKLTEGKILIFIDWFYPGFRGGGPIQSCLNLVLYLSHQYKIYVVTRNTDYGEKVGYEGILPDRWVEQDGGYRVMYLSSPSLTMLNIKRIIKEVNPDHIYINGMFSRYFSIYPLIINYMWNKNSRSFYTIAPRGMLLDSALDKKNLKKKVFLNLSGWLFRKENIRFHVTNNIEAESVKKHFPGKQFFVANNLPSQKQYPFCNLEKIPGALKLIFIARIDPIKNLLLLLQVLNSVKSANSNILLRIAGPAENPEYWLKCKKYISLLPSNIQIEIMGPLNHTSMVAALNDSHLYALLTKGENFGHSIFEALLAGRPVLISDQTPWKGLETLQIGGDFPVSEHTSFVRYIEEAITWDQSKFDELAEKSWLFAKKFIESDVNRENYWKIFALSQSSD